MKKRILICGGRDFKNWSLFDHTIAKVRPWFADQFCIIHGDAPGADRMAKQWALTNGIPGLAIPAAWDFYGKGAAGPIRNMWMLDWGLPDLVIAFPGGSGTRNMVEQARGRKIDAYEVPLIQNFRVSSPQ